MFEEAHPLVLLVFANAFVAFAIFFYYHAKLIIRLMGDSDLSKLGIGHHNNAHANLMRFIAGEIYPDIRPFWIRAVVYVLTSWALVALTSAIFQ